MEIKILGDRLKRVRKEKNLTQQGFAKLLNTSSGFISEVETEKKLPGSDFLSSLLRVFGVSLNWLFTGEGPMFMEKPNASTVGVAEPVAQYGLTVKEREIIELLRESPELEGLCLKLLGGRKSFKEAFAELQKIPDTEKTQG